ncbi:MAG: HK97 gp10 family phage protein [Candidatus Acinetobacter avistercoris]|nr:HK97 gp10 family phage protein [Candidatus Acinetobacter avistercoris]
MDSVNLNVKGMEQFQRKIEQLANPKKAKSMARKAARQAMNIARDDARARAKAIDDPETVERIHKNVKVVGGRSRNANEVVIRLGVDGGAAMNKHSNRGALAGLSGGNTTYWRHIEFGTSKQPAIPFMRPALAQNLNQITAKFVQVFDTEITKALGAL